ncbi:glycoside hydrolase family 43 protein [Brachybacterium sp. DNPG3]
MTHAPSPFPSPSPFPAQEPSAAARPSAALRAASPSPAARPSAAATAAPLGMSRRTALLGAACAGAIAAPLLVGASRADAAPTTAAPAAPGAAVAPAAPVPAPDSGPFAPGQAWTDTSGELIQAHGGQIVAHEDEQGSIYYWYGEDRSNGYASSPGVHVYSSRNLYDWDDEGLALRTLETDAQLDEDEYFVGLYGEYDDAQREAVLRDLRTVPVPGESVAMAILERPKVLHNETTGQWVMWVHADGPSETSTAQYAKARAGVAVSDGPTGPFRWIDSYRLHVAPEGEDNYDPANPGMARDMTVFRDDDGTAYIIYSSEENYSLFISRLDADYTYLATGPEDAVKGVDFIRPYIGAHREAPALFKRGGTYVLITSGATGWDPNPASYATATEILGEWTDHGNPCMGDEAGTTFRSQSTHVLPIDAERGLFVYMGDRWTPSDLKAAPYVWLPILFGEGDSMSIEWRETWRWEDLEEQPRFDVEVTMPEYIRPGKTSSLPGRVVLDRDGTTRRVKVSWGGDLDRPGITTAVGTIAAAAAGTEEDLTFTRPVLVVPKKVQYLVNAGGKETDDWLAIRDIAAGTIRNQAADQEYGREAATGAIWGYTGSSAPAGSEQESMDYTLRYAKSGQDLRYRFETLAKGRHTVHVCFYERWAGTDREASVSLNGEVVIAAQRFPTTPEVVSLEVDVPKDGGIDLVIHPTLSPDVQVSWVLVEKS